MATKYLDNAGLAYFWGKIKSYIASLLGSKADDSAVVHIAGAETVTGAKTFTGPLGGREQTAGIIIRNSQLSKGTIPTDVVYFDSIIFGDKDHELWSTGEDPNVNGRFGTVEASVDRGNETTVKLVANKNEYPSSATARLSVTCGHNGVGYATAPSTLSDRTNGTDILTRDWIPNDDRIVHSSGDETIAGTKTFSSTISGSIDGNAATATRISGPKHSYTTAANAAKNWYRIANANTSQLDTSKPIHVQFVLTAYNASYAADYYERWFVNAIVFGRTANIVVYGGSNVPFSQIRVLYENTVASIDANDRPAIDIYLNYVLPNGTTKIEVEEVYNNDGWTFLADGQLAASTVPSGFESVACSVRNNGVERSTYADYVPYLNRQISNVTAAFTLADNNTYRSRTLNCTGTFTITVPSINSGYMWCVIKNKNATSGVITLHPSTTSVLIDGSNADITLQPGEYVCIHSAGANNYSLIADGRWMSQKANAVLTGYSKPSSTSAIAATDTVPAAIGKLEKALDAKAADSGVVHNSGDETIAGGKTFSSTILTTANATLRHTNAAGFVQIGFAPIANGPRMNLFGKSYSGSAGQVQLIAYNGSSAKNLVAGADGTLTWDGQAIQTASDERLKTHLSAVPDAVLDAWSDVQWGQFQFLDAVSAKGESARLHLGLIAQRVKAVFNARGLDACAYGILCHEVHPAKPAVFDEHGEMLFPAEDAVDLWTVRYTEALAMETACQRRRADRLEKRLADLEARMTAMEVANV